MGDLHVVLPAGIDDPRRPSGGNVYDRRLCRGLVALGWTVHEHVAPVRLDLPDGALVLVDGLAAAEAPATLLADAHRFRTVALVHMSFDERDRALLGVARAVITTSGWTRGLVLARRPELVGRVHVAHPGVDVAPLATGSPEGGELICVGAVIRAKGHDVLLSALADLADLPWRCRCVGSLGREPELVGTLARDATARGLGSRFVLTGPRTGPELASDYLAADLAVLPSLGESYGMVVTEALARGLPVVASRVGGVPEALGRAPGGDTPGLLVPAGDPARLAAALRSWLEDAGLRTRLRAAALRRRAVLSGWSVTATQVDGVLAGLADGASPRVEE